MGLEQDRERCLTSLLWAIEQLQGKADSEQLEKIANLIIQTMTGQWRFFHTPEHIFEVGGTEDAIEVLAALFHDLVYVQVDQGVSVNISCYISSFIKEEEKKLIIREQSDLRSDFMFELVVAIFGFSPGQALSPMAGQNEFLSAVIAAKALEPLLVPSVIAEIVTCIEATVPFRSKENGLSACDRLYERLHPIINQDFKLGWTESKIVDVVKRAVRVANRDVENFASPNPAHFLDNTWNLLPETNHHLATPNSYTVHGYRTSIQKMEGFMNFLKADVVFQQFQAEPPSEIYDTFIKNTQRNLEAAKLYLGAKLVSIAIIEALSFRIGRDIPISTMMGELPSPDYSTPQLEHFIPPIDRHHPPETELEQEVLELLEKGRSSDSSYDVKNSPIATYVVKSVGFGEVKKWLDHAKAFFKETITAEDFLANCHPEVVQAVTDGVIKLFKSREVALEKPNRVLV